jgi:hypothetical protein
MAFRPRVSTDVPLDAASFEEQFIAHVTRIILHLSQARPYRLRYGRSLIFHHRRCRYRAYFLTFLESCEIVSTPDENLSKSDVLCVQPIRA